MGSLNKVILIGNLGRDAELKYTPSGAPVATINVATTEKWKDKQGAKQEKTTWHRCVIWGKRAEALSEYLLKGKQIAVEGRIDNREYEDRNGGGKRYISEVVVTDIQLLGGGGSGNRRNGERMEGDFGGGGFDGGDNEPMAPITDDDIQF